MDLELATTCDIVDELRQRNMRFIFIGAIQSNENAVDTTLLATQAVDRGDVYHLIRRGLNELRHLDDGRIELDHEG